jgi:hypothetical protein
MLNPQTSLVIHYPDAGPILDPETAAGKNQPFSTYVNGQHPSVVDTFYGSSELVKDLIHHGKNFSRNSPIHRMA